jgi:hypothetical protein
MRTQPVVLDPINITASRLPAPGIRIKTDDPVVTVTIMLLSYLTLALV